MQPDTGGGALFGAIAEKAAGERERILADAAARVGDILAAADAECARLRAEAEAGLEKELATEGQRLLGEARMHARMARLRSRRSMLSDVFRMAGEEIERLREGPGAARAFVLLAAEAKAAVGEPCTAEVQEAEGRVQASSADGRRQADNGLKSRLRRAETAAEPEVARLLFGQGDRRA